MMSHTSVTFGVQNENGDTSYEHTFSTPRIQSGGSSLNKETRVGNNQHLFENFKY